MAVIADPNAPERPLPTCCTRRSCASAARAWRRRSSSSTRMPIGSPSAPPPCAAFDEGGRLFVMGNGGSSWMRRMLSVEFMHPIIEKRPALPAWHDDRHGVPHGGRQRPGFLHDLHRAAPDAGPRRRPGPGHPTSGKSANVNRALQAARELGMRTVGFSGRDGGRMPEICDYCFTVPSFSIHRIQETHETLLHILWDLIHVIRGEEDVI